MPEAKTLPTADPKARVKVSARVERSLRSALRAMKDETGRDLEDLITEALTEFVTRHKRTAR